jgi:hypothetical protein
VTYTVTNTGGTTMAPVTITPSDAAFVVSGSTCTDVLALNQTCTFKVAFSPTAIAMKSATVAAAAGTVTASAMVTGNGVAAPALTLTPNVLDFGTVVIGETKQVIVTVKNVGGFTLDNFSAYVGGTMNSGPFAIEVRDCSNAPGTLAPGETCTLVVTAAPAVDLGTFTVPVASTILFKAGGAFPTTVMASANVTVSWPFMPNPGAWYFLQVKVGTTASHTFRFTNVGTKPLGPVTMSTAGSSVFSLVSDGCTTAGQYAPGAFCDVTVRFAPTTMVTSVGSLRAQVPSLLEVLALQGTTVP